MYLGIDFLITPGLKLYLIEVNVGLPGGAQEYEFAHRVHFGKASNIFDRIERTSQQVYGKTFKDYIHSLPFIGSLKPFKIWMDGKGPFPDIFHPGLRLEDKWIQYQLVKSIAPMPETMIFDPKNLAETKRFIETKKKAVLKRRLGRGGKDLPGQAGTDHRTASKLPANRRSVRSRAARKPGPAVARGAPPVPGTPGDPWFEMMRFLLRSSVCLFVGLSERSFTDRALGPLLATTGEEVGDTRPLGIWLIRSRLQQRQKDNFLRSKVVPLDELGSATDVSDFLLDICREAMVDAIHT